MCGSDEPEAVIDRREPSRRAFLTYSAGLAALAVGVPEWPRRVLAAPAPMSLQGAGGTIPVSMAMHIHSAFSEQYGSMQGHLLQAQQNAVDVIWWTDHDYRMSGLTYRKTVHFTSLTDEQPAAGEGRPWLWEIQRSGDLAAGASGSIVTNPCSPLDPVVGGSLAVSAQSQNDSVAKIGAFADANAADWNYHCSLIGQTLSIEVLPTAISSRAYLELRVTSSYHPASGGTPAGQYVLSYRFGGSGVAGTRSVSGLTGVVNVAVSRGVWNSIAVTPATDIAALWPDMDSRDFGMYALTLNAVSTGDVASGNFDYLRFTRSSGAVQLATQPEMEAGYAAAYPGVTQYQGMEISLTVPHVNWFGSGVVLTDYGTVTGGNQPKYQAFVQETVIPQIHSMGGLASYNHPFGVSSGAALPQATQDQKLATLAAAMLVDSALGTDLLEVGYPLRAGIDLAHHVGLWDVLSRNGIFLTGNGPSDDHVGTNWLRNGNNWFTSAWAVSSAESDLLTALAAGRSWCASLPWFRGGLDLLVDGVCPMGSVSVSTLATRQLAVIATGLPTNAVVQVLQGTVDYAGKTSPTPNTSVIASLSTAELAGGSVTLQVDNAVSSFVRTQVLDSTGTVVALSNPAWLLLQPPPGGIPGPRAV
jgi:hypothetical protein